MSDEKKVIWKNVYGLKTHIVGSNGVVMRKSRERLLKSGKKKELPALEVVVTKKRDIEYVQITRKYCFNYRQLLHDHFPKLFPTFITHQRQTKLSGSIPKTGELKKDNLKFIYNPKPALPNIPKKVISWDGNLFPAGNTHTMK